MKWIYVAHIPYVLLFLLFALALIFANCRGRSNL